MKTKPVPLQISAAKLRRYPTLARHFAGRKVFIFSAEHGSWWRQNSAGYTQRLEEAGVYEFDDMRYKVTGDPGKMLIFVDLESKLAHTPPPSFPEAGTVAAYLKEKEAAAASVGRMPIFIHG